MVSLLSEIEKYIKKDYPSFTAKRIKYQMLPIYYNQAILYAIRSVMKDAGVSVGPSKYVIAVDDNGNLRMEIDAHEDNTWPLEETHGIRNTLFIIKDGEGHYDEENNNLYVPESLIYKAAVYLEKNQGKQRRAREVIEEKGEGLSKAQKLYKEYLYMSEYMSKDIPIDESIGIDYLNDERLDKLLQQRADKIIEKIKETRIWFQHKLAEIPDVSFIPNETSTTNSNSTSRKKSEPSSSSSQSEKTVIPIEDRFNIYNSKNPDNLFTLSIKGVGRTHIVFYYENENNNIMIIEPISGIGATHVVYPKAQELETKSVPEIAVSYASKSTKDFLKEDNTLRTFHTTFDVFKRNCEYLVNGEDNKTHPYIKERVAKAKM